MKSFKARAELMTWGFVNKLMKKKLFIRYTPNYKIHIFMPLRFILPLILDHFSKYIHTYSIFEVYTFSLIFETCSQNKHYILNCPTTNRILHKILSESDEC